MKIRLRLTQINPKTIIEVENKSKFPTLLNQNSHRTRKNNSFHLIPVEVLAVRKALHISKMVPLLIHPNLPEVLAVLRPPRKKKSRHLNPVQLNLIHAVAVLREPPVNLSLLPALPQMDSVAKNHLHQGEHCGGVYFLFQIQVH